MKKLLALLLCLGMVGTLSACVVGGASSGSENGSVASETTSSENSSNSEETSDNGVVTETQWNEAIKEEKFNNVTFTYSALFEGKTEVSVGTVYLDGDKGAYKEDDDEPEFLDAEMLESVKDIYISTTLAVVEEFSSFTYDAENDVFVSTADIVYSVTVMGTSATITASNAKVKLDADKNIAEISCDMKQEYMNEGVKDELIMKVTFTFTNYGTTVVNVPAENE